ncbi:MAG TPA: hypothetical protein VF469_37820 [Kofleriaceae bacterium]
MSALVVHSGGFPALGPPEGSFYVVTNPELIGEIELTRDSGYRDCRVIPWPVGQTFEQLLAAEIPEQACVVVLSPGRFFRSPPDIGRRKVMVFACASTPTSLDVLGEFIAAAGRVAPDKEESRAIKFFERARAAELLRIEDPQARTRARFWHLDDSYEWHQQAGPLAWGDQQIVPSGELSATPGDIMEFDGSRRLTITGTLALHGAVIVHGDATVDLADQARIHAALDALTRHPVIATLELGEILELRAADAGGQVAVDMLEELFRGDSRYRIVQEIGFGINDSFEIAPGNVGMNEPYGGAHGVVHFGVGLTPDTRYALTFLAPHSVVFGQGDEVLIGDPGALIGKRMRVRKTAACPCAE